MGLGVVLWSLHVLPAPCSRAAESIRGQLPSLAVRTDRVGHLWFAPKICPKKSTSSSASRALPLVGWRCGWPQAWTVS